MKTTVLAVACLSLILGGCATTSHDVRGAPPSADVASVVGQNTRPDLKQVLLKERINFGYKIYGDPGAAPSQAFDDGRYLYLQFKPNEPPPIPVTRDGRLLEYEVMQGGLVKMPRADSLVLRLGPRAAFVDREDLEIIALAAPSALGASPSSNEGAGSFGGLFVEPPPKRAQQSAPASTATERGERPQSPSSAPQSDRIVINLFGDHANGVSFAGGALGPGSWRLCHAPSVRDLVAARKLKIALESEYNRVKIMLSDSCGRSGEAILERM